MNKIKPTIAIILSVLLLTSCTLAKGITQTFTYNDPQTIGGYWTVIDSTGNKYLHCKCTYWGTEDDTSMYEYDGTVLCVSGNITLIKE